MRAMTAEDFEKSLDNHSLHINVIGSQGLASISLNAPKGPWSIVVCNKHCIHCDSYLRWLDWNFFNGFDPRAGGQYKGRNINKD